MKKNISKNVANLLLEIGAMTFRFDPPYTYTSGLKSPVYLDNRLIISYPDVRRQIIDYYVETIKSEIGINKVDWISATASAAIPHGAWVAERLNLPMVFVRPSTKTYGKGGKVEGFLKKGSRVLIVEDHISTAESVSDNANSIREIGGVVEYCIATTTYETKKSLDNLSAAKIKLISLTTGKEIVETALESGKITPEEKKKIDLWFEDPPNWATKIGFG